MQKVWVHGGDRVSLDEIYDEWRIKTVTGDEVYPSIYISRELKKLGLKKGDKVIVGITGNKIEITPYHD